MLSGNEWLIIVAVPVAIALLVWLIVTSIRGSSAPKVSQARVRGSAGDVLSDVQLTTAGIRGTETHREALNTLTMTWSYIPGWAFMVAVLAFPLGMVALIARTSVVGTVVVDQESDGIVLMRMGGLFNKPTTRAINSVIEARSSTSPSWSPTSA